MLAYSRDERRQFGGAGLMVRGLGTLLRIRPLAGEAAGPASFRGAGLMGDRAVEFAQRFAAAARQRGWGDVPGAALEVVRTPRPHTGLGSGTQLGMAVARGLAELLGRRELAPADLAGAVGRGRRSAIGVHGSFHGGLIVEGGKPLDAAGAGSAGGGALAPMLMRHDFPEAWRIVLIRPRALEGLAGQREVQAFGHMPAIPEPVTARLCQLVLLSLVPAMLERDIDAFGEALYELQRRVGECFAAAQGGVYAASMLEEIVAFVRSRGVRGVGQSSWGPTLYALAADEAAAEHLADQIESRFGLTGMNEVIITAADNRGATVRHSEVGSGVVGGP